MKFQGLLRNVVLITADALCICGVWALTIWGYRIVGLAHYRFGPEYYLNLWPVVPSFLALNALFRLYHGNVFYPAAPLSPVEEMRRLFGSAVITHVGVIAVLALARQSTVDYSRFVISFSGILVAFLAQPMRDLARNVLHRLGIGQIPVVVLGSGRAAQRVIETMRGDAYIGLRPIGYFDDAKQRLPTLPRLGGLRDVLSVSKERGVEILLACVDMRVFRCQLASFTEWFSHIEYLPSAEIFPVFGSQTISFDGIGGVEMVNQDRMRLLRMEKWILDKTLSVLAFTLLLPIFAAVALLVKLTSRGPIFYRQRRLGQNGKPISIWKFRTMFVDADERLTKLMSSDPAIKAEFEANFKLRNDPRVTIFGRFLRKTSLDEIPQLFNVLAGDMALVGPRPIVEQEIAYYGNSYAIFSSVKPGVTGLWQASGRSDTNYSRRVALDVQYVLNWSPWMDVWILVKTVFAVLFMRGAC